MWNRKYNKALHLTNRYKYKSISQKGKVVVDEEGWRNTGPPPSRVRRKIEGRGRSTAFMEIETLDHRDDDESRNS